MGFSESIGQWASQSQKRIEAVHKKSLEKLAIEMTRTRNEGGAVPFLTGNLYRSLTASTSGMPSETDTRAVGSNATAVIARLHVSQAIWLGYTARYSRRMNFGFVGADSRGRVYNQAGNHFVERAIQMWPKLVAEAVREVKAKTL